MRNQLDKTTRTWGMACHLFAIIGFIVPSASVLAPLVVWLVQKAKHPFIDEQGKESVNFQFSMLIYTTSLLIMFAGFGLILVQIFRESYITILVLSLYISISIVVGVTISIFGLIVTLVAATKAYNGQFYRYPFNLRLLKQ